ncbi:MAG: hypothetical protein WCB68_18580 [Pyrinomonadaceae bacterium]
MKLNQLKNKIGGALLAFSILFGVGVASSMTAQAQQDRNDQYRRDRNDRNQQGRDEYNRNRRGRRWDRYGTYGGSFQLRQTALNAGYNEGIKKGRDDYKHNRQFDFRDESAYQKATKDYSSKLGDRELYRRYYREGFENGYNDGWNGY